MSALMAGWVDRRALKRWSRAVGEVETMDAPRVLALRNRAQVLSRRLNRVLAAADEKLHAESAGAAAVRRPMHSDWAWRPELWREQLSPPGLAAVQNKTPFGSEARIFHDCTEAEISLRQVANTDEEDVSAFGVKIDVFRFTGSFMSLVVDLPKAATDGLTREHIIRCETRRESESPLEMFARLNVKHGPNVEQLVLEIDRSRPEAMVEFDLAASDLNERRVERAWLDLIFEAPHMNQIILRDVTLSRRPRAEV